MLQEIRNFSYERRLKLLKLHSLERRSVRLGSHIRGSAIRFTTD